MLRYRIVACVLLARVPGTRVLLRDHIAMRSLWCSPNLCCSELMKIIKSSHSVKLQCPPCRCDLNLWKLALFAAGRLRQWQLFDLFQPSLGLRSLTCEKSINQTIRRCHTDNWFFQEYFSQSFNYFQQQEVIMKTKCIYEVKSLTMD